MQLRFVLLEDPITFIFLPERDKAGNNVLIDFWSDDARKKWDQHDASSKWHTTRLVFVDEAWFQRTDVD